MHAVLVHVFVLSGAGYRESYPLERLAEHNCRTFRKKFEAGCRERNAMQRDYDRLVEHTRRLERQL